LFVFSLPSSHSSLPSSHSFPIPFYNYSKKKITSSFILTILSRYFFNVLFKS
jgi:hypothetical protein